MMHIILQTETVTGIADVVAFPAMITVMMLSLKP